MIKFLTRKNDVDLTRLQEKTSILGSDKFYVEGTGSGDLRKWCSFTTLAGAITTSIINSIVPTGVMVPWLANTTPSGWVLASGRTIGSATSGATERANQDTAALYSVIWQSFGNTELPIQDSTGTPTTRGISAAADFSDNKRLPLPDARDRVVIGLGNMGGSSAGRILGFDTTLLGKTGGVETVTLTEENLPPHTHDVSVPTVEAGTGHTGTTEGTAGPDESVTSSSVGESTPVGIVQPSIVLPFIIKL